MTISQFKDRYLSAHLNTRQRLEGSLNLRRLFFAIDADRSEEHTSELQSQ